MSRNQTLRLKDRHTILKLRCEGMTQQQIAEEIGVNRSTVSRELKTLNQQLSISLSPERELKYQMGLIAIAIEELLEAWERSKKDAQTITITQGEENDTTRTQNATQTGESKYISEIRKLLERRSRLCGLDTALMFADLNNIATRVRQLGYALIPLSQVREGIPLEGLDIVPQQDPRAVEAAFRYPVGAFLTEVAEEVATIDPYAPTGAIGAIGLSPLVRPADGDVEDDSGEE